MSMVIGVKHENVVYLAADSVAASAETTVIRKEPKIFWNGEYLIGYVGSIKFGQTAKFCDLPPFPENLRHGNFATRTDVRKSAVRHDVERFFVKEFVPALRSAWYDESEAGETLEDSALLIAVDEHMYMIESNFQVGSYLHDYAAIGIAEQAALVGLDVLGGRGFEDPYLILEEVLHSIVKHSIYVKEPFMASDTQSKDVIYEIV